MHPLFASRRCTPAPSPATVHAAIGEGGLKIIIGALAGLGLLASTTSARAAEDAQSACARTVLAYADAWDHHDGAKFASLFTDTATLDLGTGPATGRAAIAELFAKRNPGGTTRHLMTNIQVTASGAGRAEGLSYLMLMAGPPQAVGGAPLDVPGFALMGEYRDRFQLERDGCRIADRRLTTVFRRARPPGPPPAAASAPSATPSR